MSAGCMPGNRIHPHHLQQGARDSTIMINAMCTAKPVTQVMNSVSLSLLKITGDYRNQQSSISWFSIHHLQQGAIDSTVMTVTAIRIFDWWAKSTYSHNLKSIHTYLPLTWSDQKINYTAILSTWGQDVLSYMHKKYVHCNP